jgi:signal transduction histidine kinase
MEITKIQLDISKLVESIISSNIRLAQNKFQNLLFDSRIKEGVFVFADKVRLIDAIDNLISNAIKYTPKGGSILVTLELTNNRIRLKVNDEGPGIKKEEQGKLFGKFQRLSARPTGGESSTGLGLYITKQVIELHDGRIWVESEYGKGSSFAIELPLNSFKTDMLTNLN